MQTPIRHLAPLLPHAGSMILLDEIVAYSDSQLQALARIGPDHLFLDENGQLPMWCAIEIMAQGVAALAGCHAHDAGQPPKLGFLLGSRQIDILRPTVAQGSLLCVQVEASTRDEASGFGVFDCRLSLLHEPGDANTDSAETVATARLSVFSPPDIEHYLQEQIA
ncbi:thioester dehydrase family protein [Advenella kashmirensis WT001]|uniref:Thioester dehydrase family protein n=1 Tax=Advenella kashmirensis (strain DSM 17095 / LMG 22695 / WT001) TaxID=1036672 RepID=I3UHS0_ADVKW|nr:thioester dehydrase [Advenella kashmirensis]AFK64558.1 thioester dehydrase family protein [Advenella kashmirensis WT001]